MSSIQDHYFEPSWIALSYVVSTMGMLSTLSALRSRTTSREVRNVVLLMVAGMTMSFVSIFCMHLTGLKAIQLTGAAKAQPFHYRPSFLLASFLQPFCIFPAVFALLGLVQTRFLKWFKYVIGGCLASAAMLSMHYTCQLAISNYEIEMQLNYVIGAVVSMLIGLNTALVILFHLRNIWAKSWWHLSICACLLAAILTSSHFCASGGLTIRSKADSTVVTSQFNQAFYPVLGLAMLLCISLLLYNTRVALPTKSRAAQKGQISVYSAIYDLSGHILVCERHGTLPSQPILEMVSQDMFDTSSFLFQWMFKASKNWSTIHDLIPSMQERLKSSEKTSDHLKVLGVTTENLDREHFCFAAQSLAGHLGLQLLDIGCCFDEVVRTGSSPASTMMTSKNEVSNLESQTVSGNQRCTEPESNDLDAGQAIFLIKQVSPEQKLHFSERGYTFVKVEAAISTIATDLEVTTDVAQGILTRMSQKLSQTSVIQPGFHVAFLSMQFDSTAAPQILVDVQNPIALPTAHVQAQSMTAADLTMLQQHFHLTLRELSQSCMPAADEHENGSRRASALSGNERRISRRQSAYVLDQLRPTSRGNSLSIPGVVQMKRQVSLPQEMSESESREEISSFASNLYEAIEELDNVVSHHDFLSARLIPHIFSIPCHGEQAGRFVHLAIFRLDYQALEQPNTSRLEWRPFEMVNTKIITESARLNNDFNSALIQEYALSNGSEKQTSYFDKKPITPKVQIHVTEISLDTPLVSPSPISPYGHPSDIMEIPEVPQSLTWLEEALLKSDKIFRTW